MKPRTIGSIDWRGRSHLVERATYPSNDHTAIVILAFGEVRAEDRGDATPQIEAVLSVNVGEHDTADGEFIVPTYKLPEALIAAALATGLFAPTGFVIAVGMAGPQPIWRVLV